MQVLPSKLELKSPFSVGYVFQIEHLKYSPQSHFIETCVIFEREKKVCVEKMMHKSG